MQLDKACSFDARHVSSGLGWLGWLKQCCNGIFLLSIRHSGLVQTWKFFWHVFCGKKFDLAENQKLDTTSAKHSEVSWPNPTSGHRHGRPEKVARPLGSAELHHWLANMFDRWFSWERRFFSVCSNGGLPVPVTQALGSWTALVSQSRRPI